jgi:prepilin-type N-terminal cleavage/methylation domain-containing protein
MFGRRAFTLIELLLVIGIVAVLAGIVITAVNPQLQLASATDANRRAGARTIQQALNQYLVDFGALPNAASITTGSTLMICKQGLSPIGCLNLDSLVPTYIAEMPQDSWVVDPNHSGFTVTRDAQGRPLVMAAYLNTTRGGAPSDYVARWKLQDNAASMTVVAEIGPTATLQGGDNTNTLSVPGPGGSIPRALLLDGMNDRFTIPATNYGKVHTLCFWINKSGTSESVVLSGNSGYTPDIDGTTMYYRASTTGGVSVAHGGASGQWMQFCIVRSNASVSFFKNGSQIGTTQTYGVNDELAITTIGARSTTTLPLSGALSDVRIYNRALSVAEVSALAANP